MTRASEVGGLGERRSMVSWLAQLSPCTGGARFTRGRPTARGEPSGEKTTADGRGGALRAFRYAIAAGRRPAAKRPSNPNFRCDACAPLDQT